MDLNEFKCITTPKFYDNILKQDIHYVPIKRIRRKSSNENINLTIDYELNKNFREDLLNSREYLFRGTFNSSDDDESSYSSIEDIKEREGLKNIQNVDNIEGNVENIQESNDFIESNFNNIENFRCRFFENFYFYEIFREAQGSLWEVSGTCSEMFGESVKFKILGFF